MYIYVYICYVALTISVLVFVTVKIIKLIQFLKTVVFVKNVISFMILTVTQTKSQIVIASSQT